MNTVKFDKKENNKLFSAALEIWLSSVKLDLKKSTIHKYENLILKAKDIKTNASDDEINDLINQITINNLEE